MRIRQSINRHAPFAVTATALVMVLSLSAIIWQVWPDRSRPIKAAYFTVDDGQTYFVDDPTKVPPFAKDGNEAYQAFVFQCGWHRPFVGYLLRYTPEAKKRLEHAIAAKENLAPGAVAFGMQAKRPGGADWVTATEEPHYDALTNIRCPDGTLDGLRSVWP